MTLLRNLLGFFVLFVPLSCTTSLVAGFSEGPIEAPRLAYDVGVFMARIFPLMLPSLLETARSNGPRRSSGCATSCWREPPKKR